MSNRVRNDNNRNKTGFSCLQSKSFFVLFLFSALVFWGMLAKTEIKSILLCAGFFLLTTLLVWKIKLPTPNRILIIGAVLLGAWNCYSLYRCFCATWAITSMGEHVAQMLGLPFRMLLSTAGVVLSFLAFPASFMFGAYLLTMGKNALHRIHFRELLKEIREDLFPVGAVKKVSGLLIRIVASALAGLVLMCFSSLLWSDSIQEHMTSSAKVFAEEGPYPTAFSWCSSMMDNFTDALILSHAANHKEAPLFDQALLDYRDWIRGAENPVDSMVKHYVHGKAFDTEKAYPRYWNGYRLGIKTALVFTDYSTIRIVNTVIQIALIAAICLMAKNQVPAFIIPLLLGYFMMMPAVLGKSLQYSTCFYIMLAAILFLIVLSKRMTQKKVCLLFLYTGIATAFFDLLTYPIATFSVPAVLYVLLIREQSLERKLSQLLKIGVCWCIGYAGMWAAKWILGNLLTDTNVIANAVATVGTRTSNLDSNGNPTIVLSRCYKLLIQWFCRTPFVIPVVLFILYAGVRVFNAHTSGMQIYGTLIPYFLLGCIPFLWYAFARNHSYIHYFFTNKTLIVTCMSLLCGAADLLKTVSERQDAGSQFCRT